MTITKLFNYQEPLVAASTILVIGALIITGIASRVVYDIRLGNDVVEVTGSAKEAVVADTARWTIHVETKTAPNAQQTGYVTLEKATEMITKYLTDSGLTEFEVPAASTYPNYTYPQYGEPILTGYTVARDIVVRTSDVAKVNTLANNIEPLMGTGYTVSSGYLELTYSKLAEMRVKLLSAAIADASARANSIAQDSGRSIGVLRNASSGVVQVLPEGGVEISDYGTYDTQSMNKEVMVTVRATFGFK